MSTDLISDAVSGVDFPASKEDLLRRAKLNGASQTVIEVLDSLPNMTHQTLLMVWEIVGMREETKNMTTDPAPSITPSHDVRYYETIEDALKQLHFPRTKSELLRESEGISVLMGKNDAVVPLRQLLRHLQEEVYTDKENVMNELNVLIKGKRT